MRLRKSSKWLILAALVAFSVLQDFPGAEAGKKGSKKGSTSKGSSSASSRSKYSRTKGKKSSSSGGSSANSSSSSSSGSSSSSASVEFIQDRVATSGINVGALNTAHYSKVFKKGPGTGNSSKSSEKNGKGKSGKKGSGKGGKGKGKKEKVVIVTPSPITTSTTTTEEIPTTVATTTTERLTFPTTKKTKRVSFGYGHESGIHSTNWVGIDSAGVTTSVNTRKGGVGIGEVIRVVPDEVMITGSVPSRNIFLGPTKDYRPLERGGLYADGLDMDFAKVYPEDVTESSVVSSSNLNGFNPVLIGTASMHHSSPHHLPQHDHPPPPLHYEGFVMKGKMEDLEKKMLELERTISTMQKNIEVLQQNTQVISKGFNILSGRVNKVTGDYELVEGKLDDHKKRMEEKFIATEQNVSLALIALQLKTTGELEDIKRTSLEALGNVTIAAANMTQGRNPADHENFVEGLMMNVTVKMEDWQKSAKNETQLLAEMVKALAEISQAEKLKLENLSNYSRKEIEKLGDILEKQNVEHAHEWDAVSAKVKALKMEVEERDKKFTSDILGMHGGLRNSTKHCEAEVKQVEEALLEQNMAHNMAHENIAVKIDELTVALEDYQKKSSSVKDVQVLRRLSGAEANITTLFAATKQFLQQFAGMEEMNGLILSKITDIRTVHKNDNATTKKDLFEMKRSITKMEHDNRVILDRLRDLQSRVDQARQDTIHQIDIGRLGLGGAVSVTEIDDSPTPTQISIAMQVEMGELKDRIATFEENIAELWRSNKQVKNMIEHSGDMVTALQTAHLADHEDVSLQIMEIKIASKMLSEVVRNLNRNVTDLMTVLMENQIENRVNKGTLAKVSSGYNHGYSNFSSRLGELEKMDTGSLGLPSDTSSRDCKALEEDLDNLWELSRNISKAQELFLVKLLEMDMEHERDNKTVRQMLMFVMNRTEDFNMQFLTADERINKILQQFEFTDAEQAKMREELLNIKDRLASSEENYQALWKASRQLEKGQDEIQNNVDNIILVHKTEMKNLTNDMSLSRYKFDNISHSLFVITDRVNNLEILMDMDISHEGKTGRAEVNTTEMSKLKGRLASNEHDIQELWKSSEILSFQQQVFNEKVKDLQTVHENDTLAASVERMRNQLEIQSLDSGLGNVSIRLKNVEKYTSPPHESKTIEFEIANWKEALAGGLKNQQVVYDIGKLLDIPCTWRTFVERSGNFIALYNSLVKSEQPIYNEFTVEILDSDGRVFSTYGPDMHLYKMNEKIGWSSMISMSALQNPSNRLLTNNALRFRLRTKLFPNGKQDEDSEDQTGPKEKQLIMWEIPGIASKLRRNIDEDQAFVDLNVSKEFQAGHYWGGETRWKTSLLMREIHQQNYLGINMELLHVDQNWRELVASYNVTLLDAHNRIVKEFSIASNDFKAVSARHSYFMLVSDVLQVLERGDKLTVKIFFDLQARKRSFDVEFIRT